MPIRTLSTSTSTSTSSSHTLSNYAAGATATLLTFAGLGYLFNPNKEEISLQSATQIQKVSNYFGALHSSFLALLKESNWDRFLSENSG